MIIRPARPDDVAEVIQMVRDLAEYERALEYALATEEQFTAALFGQNPAVYLHVVEHPNEHGKLAGYALWFLNFSTWLGVHGIYLEDLYVRPELRGHGYGQALLRTLAQICVERGYGRLEWWVLNWNPAREFYESSAVNAIAMDEWIPYRVTGDALQQLATDDGMST